jgi:hypothetical protein
LDDTLIAIRASQFASTALLCGLMLFLLFVGDPAFRRAGASPELARLHRRFCTLAWIALVLSVLTGAAWLVVLSARITGASRWSTWMQFDPCSPKRRSGTPGWCGSDLRF